MKRYQTGGAIDPMAGEVLGQSSSLSPWAGPYVTGMLGKGAALANMPYTPYQGPLTAGQSALQNQAFQGLANLALPLASRVGSFAGSMPSYGGMQAPQASQQGNLGYEGPVIDMGNGIVQQVMGMQAPQAPQAPQQSVAQQYMNPYTQMALDPQMNEARRQAQIEQQNLQSRYSKAGAYGGGRQAVADVELSGALQRNLANIYGTGMQQAYDKAADLFNQERQYGLGMLGQQLGAGAQQRAIEQEGVLADIAQFEQERDYPYKQVQYMQSLLQGLPISTQSYQYAQPSTFAGALGGATGIAELIKLFGEL